MNYQLTDEQTMLLDSLHGFLEEEIYPHEIARSQLRPCEQ